MSSPRTPVILAIDSGASRGRCGVITGVNGLALDVRGPQEASPVLIVGPGPGFPLLHEAERIERALELEGWQAAFLERAAADGLSVTASLHRASNNRSKTSRPPRIGSRPARTRAWS